MRDGAARGGATILVTGASGQLGTELCRSLALLGRVVPATRAMCDVASRDQVADTIRSIKPDVVVNASGYTAVDAAETDSENAYAVNAVGPGVLAEESRKIGALLVHYSTDYVFDGMSPVPYSEEDPTRPLSVYGRSKLDGEQAVNAAAGAHWTFRTSWIYSSQGSNFMKSIARAARNRDALSVVYDQTGAPTAASLIAEVATLAIREYLQGPEPMPWGIYHVAAAGAVNWHAYARHIIERLIAAGVPVAVTPEHVSPVTAAQYGSAAMRPANSRLDTSKLRRALRIDLPDWQVDADRTLADLLEGERVLG